MKNCLVILLLFAAPFVPLLSMVYWKAVGRFYGTIAENFGWTTWWVGFWRECGGPLGTLVRNSDDTGLSSMFMAGVLSGEFVRENNHPHDPDDLGRCIRMLEACPELVPRLHRMKEHGPAWAALIDNWDELSAMYHRELPSGMAPETYKRMQELLEAVS